MTQSEAIDNLLTSHPEAVLSEEYDLKIVTFRSHHDKPCVCIWIGRQRDPRYSYHFPCEASRKTFINDELVLAQERDLSRNRKKTFVPQARPGDIFRSVWGYEQTNVDYYQVISRPSRHYGIFRRIACQQVPGSLHPAHGMADKVIATPNAFLKNSSPFRSKILDAGDGKESIRIDTISVAISDDGKPTYRSWYA